MSDRYLKASANISQDGLYRYELYRVWQEPPHRLLCWVMLNPSTADGEKDDPTIRRVVNFSKANGYGAAVVVNLFALRVTQPKHLFDHPDPIGPDNERVAEFWIAHCPTVAAWGSHQLAPSRRAWFDKVARRGEGTFCLGLTKQGAPKHPLYLPAATDLVPFDVTRREATASRRD